MMLAARSVTMSFLRLAATLAALAVFTAPAEAQINYTNRLISSRQPDGMILSTGNIYFTTHDQCGGHVWRTAQWSKPGQEIQIYADNASQFSDIVFAKVDGTFYGYFLAATSPLPHFCQVRAGVHGVVQRSAIQHNVVHQGPMHLTYSIKSIHLDGSGTAMTLKVLSNVDIEKGHRNLVTDGSFLYWQDTTSVRRMPIGGGPDIALDTIASDMPTAGLSLNDKNLYYASGNAIYSVQKDGAASGALVTPTLARVTTLQAVWNGDVYWGQQDGSVCARFDGHIVELAPSRPVVPTSITTFPPNSQVALTTQCDASSCELRYDGGKNVAGAPVGAGALGLTAPEQVFLYWGDAAGIHESPLGLTADNGEPPATVTTPNQCNGLVLRRAVVKP
jgi:hypothetical protein